MNKKIEFIGALDERLVFDDFIIKAVVHKWQMR